MAGIADLAAQENIAMRKIAIFAGSILCYIGASWLGYRIGVPRVIMRIDPPRAPVVGELLYVPVPTDKASVYHCDKCFISGQKGPLIVIGNGTTVWKADIKDTEFGMILDGGYSKIAGVNFIGSEKTRVGIWFGSPSSSLVGIGHSNALPGGRNAPKP